MKALVLCAGEGTRLRPLTLTCPKPMLPVGDYPLLAYLLVLLRRHGVREVAINLHHLPDAIRGYVGRGERFGLTVVYSVEEELLGTAGAARRLEGFLDEPFFVLYGDVLTTVDLTALAAFHRARRALATLALHEAEDPSRVGVVEIEGSGRIRRFVEKPRPGEEPGRLANAGIYVVEPAALRHVPADRPFDFGFDLFPALLAQGLAVYGLPTPALVVDIGGPARYRQAQATARRLVAEGAFPALRHLDEWAVGSSGQWAVGGR